MFGILLLVLLAVFYTSSGSSVPVPPPYAPPAKKEEKETRTIIIIIIVVIILVVIIPIILALYFFWAVGRAVERGIGWFGEWLGNWTATPTATLSYFTKAVVNTTYYYNTTVLNTSRLIEPENVTVSITGYINIGLSGARNTYASQDTGVYVMWYDVNQNYKLDANDKFSVKTDNINLGGKYFKLEYRPNGLTIDSEYLPY